MVTMRSLPLVFLVAAAACGTSDSPAEPSGPSTTIQVLEQFSADAVREGQPELAAVLGQVIRAARLGVTPSTLPVRVDGATTDFEAMVTAVSVPALGPVPALTLRLLVAVRGVDANAQVLLVASPAELATLVDMPTGERPDPLTSAGAVLLEGSRGARWAGSAGTTSLKSRSTGTACATAPASGTCTTGTFDVTLAGTFTRADQSASAAIAFSGVVNGATLTP